MPSFSDLLIVVAVAVAVAFAAPFLLAEPEAAPLAAI
jgi:hypothetical protein